MNLRPLAVSLWQHGVSVLLWAYLFGMLAVWGLLALGGDRWWFATVMLFAPRWIYGLPLAALVPLALLARRWRGLGLLAAAAVVLVWPIMGLCVPWPSSASQDGPALRVMTCNLDGDFGDRLKLSALLDEQQPEMFVIEECPATFSDTYFAPWHVRRSGNLVVGSRRPIGKVRVRVNKTPGNPWPRADAICIEVKTPAGAVWFCGVHLQTPREGLGQVLSRKIGVAPWRRQELEEGTAARRLESQEVTDWLRQFPKPLIVAGDFNMPTDSGIYQDCWSGYTNAFSTRGWGYGYTKWTPLKGSHYGLRIDHILTDGGLSPRRAWVGPDVGSDHLPMLADLGRG